VPGPKGEVYRLPLTGREKNAYECNMDSIITGAEKVGRGEKKEGDRSVRHFPFDIFQMGEGNNVQGKCPSTRHGYPPHP